MALSMLLLLNRVSHDDVEQAARIFGEDFGIVLLGNAHTSGRGRNPWFETNFFYDVLPKSAEVTLRLSLSLRSPRLFLSAVSFVELRVPSAPSGARASLVSPTAVLLR